LLAQARISIRSWASALRCSRFCSHQCVYNSWNCSNEEKGRFFAIFSGTIKN
jgi:hypothetical protein